MICWSFQRGIRAYQRQGQRGDGKRAVYLAYIPEEGLADPAQAKIPDMQELKQAAEHMDFEQVQIDPQASTVYLPDEEMSLDVGAIAKGYATKRLAETLKEPA